MGAPKKLGTEGSATRAAMIDAAEQLIVEEGYAAITARRLADKAGVKFQLIYYYFNSLDDLFLEVFERGAERQLEQMNAALESDAPLRALWRYSIDSTDTRFILEFMVMANHHEVIRKAIGDFAERLRQVQVEAIARHLQARGVEPQIPPVVISLLVSSLSRSLMLETALGVTSGHEELETLVDSFLRVLDTGST
ncbi:TetR/AcrR family transcriptional regulator [Phenylobacterium sp. LjRoot219]|uniref:TetR/AcrR family transcriptional regulator n=1 Tax=Phenylobacterium sp. LjRoot219 TaxID=3342283 RepID=UPI003ECE222B